LCTSTRSTAAVSHFGAKVLLREKSKETFRVKATAGEGAPRIRDFQPGAEGPRFLAHQVVFAGVRALKPVDKDLGGFGVVVAEWSMPISDARRPAWYACRKME